MSISSVNLECGDGKQGRRDWSSSVSREMLLESFGSTAVADVVAHVEIEMEEACAITL
jgi:hypothetical protein